MNVVSTKQISANEFELVVKVEKEEFAAACTDAFRKNVSKISVPGFRKGKAPRAIIEKMYGKEVFYEDAVNALYPKAWTEAVATLTRPAVDEPKVEINDLTEEGFTFTAVVTVKPEVEVGEYKGLKVTKNVYTVSEEEVTAEITRLQERNARTISVEGRAAEQGDIAVIDFEGFVDGVAFEGGKGEGFSLTLGSGQFIPGFEEQVVGHNIDEEFDIDVTFPEEYGASELAGKAAVFKIKLHELKTKELPEADDEFAKDVSEFDTIAELRADLTAKMQERNDKRAQDELENDLVQQICESLKGEIPECMIERSIDGMVENFGQRLMQQGIDLNTYLQYTQMEMDSFRKTFREQADRQVKIRLALEKIVELEKLEASEEEVTAKYEELSKMYGIELEQIKLYIPEADLKMDMAANMAIDLIRDSAVVEEKAPEEKTEEVKPAKKPRKTTKKAAEKKEEAEETPAE